MSKTKRKAPSERKKNAPRPETRRLAGGEDAASLLDKQWALQERIAKGKADFDVTDKPLIAIACEQLDEAENESNVKFYLDRFYSAVEDGDRSAATSALIEAKLYAEEIANALEDAQDKLELKKAKS